MRSQAFGRSPVAPQASRVRLKEVRTVRGPACWAGLISTDPAVMSGQAVIAGTRVPVSVVLDCLAAGMSAEQIASQYPTLASAGARAAAAYGALLAREELVPLSPE